MRRLRILIQSSIPIVGAVIIFLALIFFGDDLPYTRLGIVLVGILVIEAGVWGLTNPFLPSERKYLGLRAEVDDFILLVRALNQTTLDARATGDAETWARVKDILGYMHDSVDDMGELAGKTVEDLEAEQQPSPATPESA